MKKFTKPSQIWAWAAKNLEQGEGSLYSDGKYCALGAIGHAIGLSDEKLGNNPAQYSYPRIYAWDGLKDLEYDLMQIYGREEALYHVAIHSIYNLNDQEGWTFEQFAIAAKMLGH